MKGHTDQFYFRLYLETEVTIRMVNLLHKRELGLSICLKCTYYILFDWISRV